MATSKRSTKKSVARRKNAAKNSNCRPTFKISHAGHLLSTRGSSRAGSVLSKEGKKEKAKRKKRGCLGGVPKGKSFKLTAKQKRNLPPGLQKAILKFHHGK